MNKEQSTNKLITILERGKIPPSKMNSKIVSKQTNSQIYKHIHNFLFCKKLTEIDHSENISKLIRY